MFTTGYICWSLVLLLTCQLNSSNLFPLPGGLGSLGFDLMPMLSFQLRTHPIWVLIFRGYFSVEFLTKFALSALSLFFSFEEKYLTTFKRLWQWCSPSDSRPRYIKLHFYWDICMLLIILKYHAKKKRVKSNKFPPSKLSPSSFSSSSFNLLFKTLSSLVKFWITDCTVSWRGLEVQWTVFYNIFKKQLWTFSFLISFYYWHIGWAVVTEFVITTYDSL